MSPGGNVIKVGNYPISGPNTRESVTYVTSERFAPLLTRRGKDSRIDLLILEWKVFFFDGTGCALRHTRQAGDLPEPMMKPFEQEKIDEVHTCFEK
jgi:hypothetical protein